LSVWRLRAATGDDLDAIMSIESVVFASDAWSRETMLAELSNGNTHYLVAFHPETPGTVEAYAGLLAPRGAQHAEIQTIAVAESVRRQGLGRTLIDALLSEASSRGASDVFLEVRSDNPDAQRLYRAIGFVQIGLRKGYYQPDGIDAIVMRLSLAEVGETALVGE
jgi:[ribosomal protein S18]-alanine N-acetyltransferase